jgi:hypothetical protein
MQQTLSTNFMLVQAYYFSTLGLSLLPTEVQTRLSVEMQHFADYQPCPIFTYLLLPNRLYERQEKYYKM